MSQTMGVILISVILSRRSRASMLLSQPAGIAAKDGRRTPCFVALFFVTTPMHKSGGPSTVLRRRIPAGCECSETCGGFGGSG
jgi:hypothetical protein